MESFMIRTKLSRSGIFLGMLVAALVAAPAAHARSGAYRYAPDYSDIRGFNYNTASSLNTEDQWRNYKHAEVDRDFGYAQRLGLNSVRVFLSYKAWLADKAAFRANLRDFVRTAAAHRIGAMIEVVNGPGGMMPDLFEESAKPKLREYVKDLVDTIGNEPGLSFWDAANEPDWVRPPEAMPNTNQPQRIAVAKFVASVFQELDTDTPVTIGCLFLTCTMETASFGTCQPL
jgi:endo-1,4-beta-mannosidase